MSEALDRLYDGVRASDEVIAKVLNITPVARIARLERRLREYLFLKWEALADEATKKAVALARQGKGEKEIVAAVDRVMARFPSTVRSRVERDSQEIYGLARQAGWKKATGQTKAGLTYDLPNLTELKKALPPPEFSLDASLDVVDREAAKALAGQQMLWVGEHYDKNVRDAIQQSTKLSIIESGHDPRKAGQMLEGMLPDKLRKYGSVPGGYKGSSRSYFEGVAANAATVGRVHGQLRSMIDVGVTRYTIVNPVDERTCPVCSHMNGASFTVKEGADQMFRELSAKKPEDIKSIHPWVGAKQLREISPKGGKDADNVALSKAGLAMPPYHFKCRCTVDIDESSPLSFESLEPPTPTKPARVPRAPGKKATAKTISKAKAGGLHGTSFAGDGGAVENFDVQARLAKNAAGQELYEFQYKLTPGAAEPARSWMSNQGAKSDRWYFGKRKLDPDGILRDSSMPGSSTVSSMRLTLAGSRGRPEVVIDLGQTGALTNAVRIRVATGDPKKALKMLSEIAEKMGVAEITGAPTAQLTDLAIKAKIVTQFDPALSYNIYGKRITDNLINPLFEQIAAKSPVVREILKDATLRENFPGHTALFSKAQADYFKKAGVRGLYHDADINMTQLSAILAGENPGLLASAARFDRGIFTEGMSTLEDFGTGGADGVFTRVVRNASDLKNGSSYRVRFIVKTEELGRQDWWAFPRDRYGAAGPQQLSGRMSAPQIAKDFKRLDGGNEVMFQKGVSIKNIKSILVGDETQRQWILEDLKKKGITKLGGRSIDKLIVVKH